MRQAAPGVVTFYFLFLVLFHHMNAHLPCRQQQKQRRVYLAVAAGWRCSCRSLDRRCATYGHGCHWFDGKNNYYYATVVNVAILCGSLSLNLCPKLSRTTLFNRISAIGRYIGQIPSLSQLPILNRNVPKIANVRAA